MLMSVQMAFAQQNMVVVGSNGSVNVVSISSGNYATFNANSKWFSITNDGIKGTSNNSISASCTVSLSTDTDIKELEVTPKVGVCYSKDNTTPTIDDNCKLLGLELKSYTFSLSSLISGTTYYFRTYVKLADGVFYGDVTNAKTLGTAPVDNSKTINGHKFIDLGLPSGLLWAETNVGAETAADDGNYYAWGETDSKSNFAWNTYKHGTSSSDLTKYNATDGKTTLDKEDDAAAVNWGDSCRMPTNDEFGELLNSEYCTWTWTSMTDSNGSYINGFQVASVKNGNYIFLPASGYFCREELDFRGSNGYYWSCTLGSSTYNACSIRFSSRYRSQDSSSRCFGLTVRPVAKP